jgi:hypothetical protein
MTTLMIKDLLLTEELSPEQLQKIHGGMLVLTSLDRRPRTTSTTFADDYIRVTDPISVPTAE